MPSCPFEARHQAGFRATVTSRIEYPTCHFATMAISRAQSGAERSGWTGTGSTDHSAVRVLRLGWRAHFIGRNGLRAIRVIKVLEQAIRPTNIDRQSHRILAISCAVRSERADRKPWQVFRPRATNKTSVNRTCTMTDISPSRRAGDGGYRVPIRLAAESPCEWDCSAGD